MNELILRNLQKVQPIDLPLLRRIVIAALREDFRMSGFELGVRLVAAGEMARVNAQFLNHEGSTDVITFDYSAAPSKSAVHGEIFVCLDDAMRQARQFRTRWQEEVVRYIVHGVLHLQGFDDMTPAARQVMKREENRIMKSLAARFALVKLRKAVKHA